MSTIEGYDVQTTEGKTVGHVIGESELALVVACGGWPRKKWRALPKQLASVDSENSRVLTSVTKDFLTQSPELKHGAPVDDAAVVSWWGVD